MRGQTAPIPHLVHPWWWDECRELLQEFQRRQLDAPGTIRPGLSEGVDEIATLILRQALQGDRTSGGIADQTLELIATMGGNMSIGVQGGLGYVLPPHPPASDNRTALANVLAANSSKCKHTPPSASARRWARPSRIAPCSVSTTKDGTPA